MIKFLIFTGSFYFLISCNPKTAEMDKQNIEMKNYFDSTGNVFIKLYKKNNDSYLYWETWNINSTKAITHWGTIGDIGKSENINEGSLKKLKTSINLLIEKKLKEGYSEIPIDKQYTVSITFKLKTWGTAEDLDRREFIRNIITENLGWTGNGRCDDGDIGSGEMTLFADVVDPEIAIKTITKEFDQKNIMDEHTFGIMLGDSTITTDYKKIKK